MKRPSVTNPGLEIAPVEEDRSVDVLLGDLGAAGGQPQHGVKVVGDVRVQAARQVPRLDDPCVVQAEPLTGPG